MSGYLTTHVLDTARGRPAAGLEIELFRIVDGRRDAISKSTTNADGRTDAPILPKESFEKGTYELLFHVGNYLRSKDANPVTSTDTSADPGGRQAAFLDLVPIRFEMGEDAHYHVPLLLSPFGYSTYRGS